MTDRHRLRRQLVRPGLRVRRGRGPSARHEVPLPRGRRERRGGHHRARSRLPHGRARAPRAGAPPDKKLEPVEEQAARARVRRRRSWPTATAASATRRREATGRSSTPNAELPVGVALDARRGKVNLRTAGCRGGVQAGVFGGGVFSVRQPRKACGRVDVYLRGGSFAELRPGVAPRRFAHRLGIPLAQGPAALGTRQRRPLPQPWPPQPRDGARHPLADRRPLRRHAHARDRRLGGRPRLPDPPERRRARGPFLPRARRAAARAGAPQPGRGLGTLAPERWSATTPRRLSPNGRRFGPTSTPGRSRTSPATAPTRTCS